MNYYTLGNLNVYNISYEYLEFVQVHTCTLLTDSPTANVPAICATTLLASLAV